jgi:dynactin 1
VRNPHGQIIGLTPILQIEAYRGTVRFLRMENSYLKGQDLLHEMQALPELRASSSLSRTPTPPLEPSGLSDTGEEDDESDSEGLPKMRSKPPQTLRSLSTETKLLYRDVIRFSASPRVVDLSTTSANRNRSKQLEDGSVVAVGRGWVPRKKMPAHQVWERKVEGDRLSRRVKGLMERASSLGKDL